jgi:hypothetical protein
MITDSDHLHHPAWVPSLLSGQTTSPHRLASSDDIRPVDRPIGISDAWHDVLKRSSQVGVTTFCRSRRAFFASSRGLP